MPSIVWIWLAAAVVFLILELATPTLIFACFVVGSLAAGVYSAFAVDGYYMQIGIFLAVSVVLLPLTRTLAKKITKPSPQASNIDALIGKVGLVTKAIDPDLAGQVRFEGETWAAVSDEPIAVNEKVVVTSVTGTKVHVHRKNSEG